MTNTLTQTKPTQVSTAKREATWIARAALVGHQLRCIERGRWLAHKNSWSRELAESKVEAWLRQVEGVQG